MFGFMRRPKAEIEIRTGQQRVSPGDSVQIQVSISGKKAFDVRSAVVRLRCVETYWKREYDAATKSTRNKKKQRTLAEVPIEIMSNGKIRPGLPHREELTLDVPQDAPLTITGKLANIEWTAGTSLDVPGARDLHADQAFVVAAAPVVPNDRAEDSDESTAEEVIGDGTLQLHLPDRGWLTGESIEGAIRLDATDDCSFDEVRAVLERREKAGSQDSTVVADEAVLEREVTCRRGLRREWRFSLALPDGEWPSTSVSDTMVTWVVKGVLAKTRRRDDAVEQEITVG